MDLAALRIFKAVVEYGGINKAAAKLHRVPSNVTTRVKQLEESLGTKLFVRQSRRLALSQEGRLLLTYADRLLRLSSEAETASFFNNSAVQAVKEGKLEESLKLYEIALKTLKTDRFKAQIYFNIALNNRKLQRLDEAQKAAKRAVKYDSSFEKAKKQLEEIEAILAKKSA